MARQRIFNVSSAVTINSKQHKFCIALSVAKKIFGYSVLRNLLQKKLIAFLEAVSITQDIANEVKSLRQNAEHELHQVRISLQFAKTKNFALEAQRPTSRLTNRCDIAGATNEEYFQVGFLSHFLIISMSPLTRGLLSSNQIYYRWVAALNSG